AVIQRDNGGLMSNKTHRKRHHREQKREQFSQPAKRNYNWLMLVVIVALLAVIGYLVTSRLKPDPTTTVASAKEIQIAPGASELRLPVNEISEGKAKFYEAALGNGSSVRFFVVKTADGIYRTALMPVRSASTRTKVTTRTATTWFAASADAISRSLQSGTELQGVIRWACMGQSRVTAW